MPTSRLLSILLTVAVLAAPMAVADEKPESGVEPKRRRILYNDDGDACMRHKAGGSGPVAITPEDLPNILAELTQPGSQVDTYLLCLNAKVTYYPTKVGTLRGTLSTPEEREKWSAYERQRLENMNAFFAAGVDPYAVILAEAKQRGLETLISYRVNDQHGNEFLAPAFWKEHPEFQLGPGFDFAHAEVRDYVFRLIVEEMRRYECDGLELDFLRHIPLFKAEGLSQDEKIELIDAFIERVRKFLDELGNERGEPLILAVRVPATIDESLAAGLDPIAWAERGWIDFLTVSDRFRQRSDWSVKPWKERITTIPVYAAIQYVEDMKDQPRRMLKPDEFRQRARQMWSDGADGIYLFNFFCYREQKPPLEPPFEVLNDLGDLKTLDD